MIEPTSNKNISEAILRCIEQENTIASLLESICSVISEQYAPAVCGCSIEFNGQEHRSVNFKPCKTIIRTQFETIENNDVWIKVFFNGNEKEAKETPEYKIISEQIPLWKTMIKGALSVYRLKDISHEHGERNKELRAINSTSEIIIKARSLEDVFMQICDMIPDSFQYPEHTVVRIRYNKQVYTSKSFEETQWGITQYFQTISSKRGSIEVFYTQKFPDIDEGPFLKEERNLLINLAGLIAGRAVKDGFLQLQRANTERLKELDAINRTTQILEESNNIKEALQRICNILPISWQYPKHTACRIIFEGYVFQTANFSDSAWSQKDLISTIDNKKGSIEIVYLKEFPEEYEGPFLLEEKNLLRNITKLITGYLNSYKGFEALHKRNVPDSLLDMKSDEFRKSLIQQTKKPLQLYFNQQSLEKYVYLDMMKYKVKHILFVSTLYDAFMLESDDSFFEKFMGEIYQYSLFSLPRITGVSSAEQAIELLETTHFDMVILMAGIDRNAPLYMSELIRKKNEKIPIYLLLNKKNDLKYFETIVPTINSIDKIFVWNGDSLILFAMVKSTEDRINVENDTRIGLVRVILLIEDSPLYYSRYLQTLYSIVFDQVRQILPEVEKNELNKICKMRSRPKVLLARNYEEALAIFNTYKDYMLCVISDVEFERSGKLDKEAGAKFISYAHKQLHNLPVILQSSDEQNALLADKLGVSFLNKNSDNLIKDLTKYLKSYLGFGNFIFRDANDNKIAEAKSLREFENLIATVPDESFYIHAHQNQFSIWLMARGEIELAKSLYPIRVDDFESIEENRLFILDKFKAYREEKKRGKIISFDETARIDERNIVSFCKGSLGGKGRGLGFVNVLLYNTDFSELTPYINILTPITVVIGTNEFQKFITSNKLHDKITNQKIPYEKLREHFAKGKLSASLMHKIRVFVNQIDKPIAVRSSSTSEDSITHPFSGVFDTYIIPNSKTNKKKVIDLIADAIKMVYASVYSKDARVYFEAINHRIDDEKMAIIIQELVGSYHNDYYYPHISGVAQSYNFYPVGDMKPEEGFAVTAVGLGSYVVNGFKSFRFSPTYPNVSVYSIKDLLQSTQMQFYALNTKNIDLDFIHKGELAALELLDISEAEAHGTLAHCASVYNAQNDTIEAGLSIPGPRIVNFANILQHNYIPLAKTIDSILRTVEETFGSPVEIEFAVDLSPGKNNKPSFYVLQIKPLLTGLVSQEIDFSKIKQQDILLQSTLSLGNGEISDITDVVFIAPETFNKLETLEMAAEIEKINADMIKENRKYILIGPGRWGTRDQFLGVPVTWSQISNAKVIIETSLDNFPLDSSLGSHFFHNITSMNIGYFSVSHNSKNDSIAWELLQKQAVIMSTKHYKHIRFTKPLHVLMDGKKKTSVILTSPYKRKQ